MLRLDSRRAGKGPEHHGDSHHNSVELHPPHHELHHHAQSLSQDRVFAHVFTPFAEV